MESMITSELKKQEELLRSGLKEKYNLPDKEIDNILSGVEQMVQQMIKLSKDGKSAHEKFFSDIILNSIDAIIGFDNEYKIFLWNKGAENIFGYTKAEVTGKDFSFLIPYNLLVKGEKDFLIDEVIEKGFLANHETERITKSGEIKNVSISRFAVSNEENEMIGSVGIIRDITPLKKLQQEMRERENLALIGEVVSSIAHSLSNPLNIISGNADFLLFDKKENDKDYEEIKIILDETTRITKSIRHLLNFSRPLHTEKKENNLNEIILKVISELKFLSGSNKIKIKKSLSKELPVFKFDNSQIEEIISNIVTNAMQAIPKEGEIIVKSIFEDNKIILEISDNGNGIAKENLPKIFLPFYSTKEYGKGTGLGLAISRRVVIEHGGEITVESKVGKGTKFKITFPV